MKEYIERTRAIEAFDDPSVERYYGDVDPDSVIRVIERIPAADVRPVVLCRDCIFRSNEWTGCPKLNGTITGDEFFCKCGIKKREGE